MNFTDESYSNERIELHGKSFRGCTFTDCELVYDGDRSPTFANNRFIDTKFVFTGASLRTLYFLGNMYHAGEGGKEVIEKTFTDIMNGDVHGHEVSTIIPNTVDHSIHAAAV